MLNEMGVLKYNFLILLFESRFVRILWYLFDYGFVFRIVFEYLDDMI